ncbi:hypothetical protein HK098_004532 [Nowakowskiella sp. JEL0407]|nr:hypothetical protein HK098_004528 [Nowakowskiella sp. JEL0407]KAJ3120558.1 hypothetical protein HK098_004532 [Nowakowskiella sp. JEL0407]
MPQLSFAKRYGFLISNFALYATLATLSLTYTRKYLELEELKLAHGIRIERLKERKRQVLEELSGLDG